MRVSRSSTNRDMIYELSRDQTFATILRLRNITSQHETRDKTTPRKTWQCTVRTVRAHLVFVCGAGQSVARRTPSRLPLHASLAHLAHRVLPVRPIRHSVRHEPEFVEGSENPSEPISSREPAPERVLLSAPVRLACQYASRAFPARRAKASLTSISARENPGNVPTPSIGSERHPTFACSVLYQVPEVSHID